MLYSWYYYCFEANTKQDISTFSKKNTDGEQKIRFSNDSVTKIRNTNLDFSFGNTLDMLSKGHDQWSLQSSAEADRVKVP